MRFCFRQIVSCRVIDSRAKLSLGVFPIYGLLGIDVDHSGAMLANCLKSIENLISFLLRKSKLFREGIELFADVFTVNGFPAMQVLDELRSDAIEFTLRIGGKFAFNQVALRIYYFAALVDSLTAFVYKLALTVNELAFLVDELSALVDEFSLLVDELTLLISLESFSIRRTISGGRSRVARRRLFVCRDRIGRRTLIAGGRSVGLLRDGFSCGSSRGDCFAGSRFARSGFQFRSIDDGVTVKKRAPVRDRFGCSICAADRYRLVRCSVSHHLDGAGRGVNFFAEVQHILATSRDTFKSDRHN